MRHGMDTAGKTENFVSRNVRLITFLVCIAVFLTLATLLGLMIHDDWRYRPAEDDRPVMTIEQLRDVGTRAKSLRGEELARYRGDNYDRQIEGVTVERYYYINGIGDRYNLSATERVSDGKIMYLTVYDMESKEEIDLLNKDSDFEDFLAD